MSDRHWHRVDERPEPGRRIVAIFHDGSGAELYLVSDDGLMDADGYKFPAFPARYSHWAYLPDGYYLDSELVDRGRP
jgi:hypothetical protein